MAGLLSPSKRRGLLAGLEPEELRGLLASSPYRNYDPERDPYAQRTRRTSAPEPSTGTAADYFKGLLASVVGAPADIGNLVLRDAPRAIASPLIDLVGGQQPAPLPPFSERFGTSDSIAQALGADLSTDSAQQGLWGIPGADDVAKNLAGAALLGVRRGGGVMDWFTPSPDLGEAERAIESRFVAQLDSDIEGSIEAYNSMPSTRGGKIIAVDDVRELDPDYAADRSLSAAVHEPASAFSKELWARKLAEPGDGEIMLMSGGTGAGKTTGLQHLESELDGFHAVFDSNLQSLKKAEAKIEEALESGRPVRILHVWRDPVEAFSGAGGSALSRAMKNGGTGRTVPLEAHVATHVGSNRAIKQLAERYADDDRVNITIIDNSNGKGGSRDMGGDTSVIQDIDEQELRDAISIELEKAREAGRITEKVYRGFKGQQ